MYASTVWGKESKDMLRSLLESKVFTQHPNRLKGEIDAHGQNGWTSLIFAAGSFFYFFIFCFNNTPQTMYREYYIVIRILTRT